jgi:hypothetical protein
MIEVPEIKNSQDYLNFIKTLPTYEDEKLKDFISYGNKSKWTDFVSGWFFSGVNKENVNKLQPKESIDKSKALIVVSLILKDWQFKHEHKEALAAYLMNEWFV